jgi:ribosomal protein S18 acetylase RimI-like enzyme
MKITLNEYLHESNMNNIKFLINKNKFKLFINDILIAESGFNIEHPDEWINEKYISLYSLKVMKKYQGQGYSKYLLNKIFKYVKNILDINIITLIVDKNNYKAVNLYFNSGFKIFQEFNNSYTLIKKLN